MAHNFNIQSHRGANQLSTYSARSQASLNPYRLLPQEIKYPRGSDGLHLKPVIKYSIAFYDSSVGGQGVPINQPSGGHSPILTVMDGSDLIFANHPYMRTMSLHIMVRLISSSIRIPCTRVNHPPSGLDTKHYLALRSRRISQSTPLL